MKYELLTGIVIAALLASAVAVAEVDADDGGFDITDGEGRTFHFDGAAERIVTSSYATTLTVAEAGAIDKIVAADRYSMYEYYGNETLRDLDAVNLGSFYGTGNHDYIYTTLVNMVENGEFSLDDTILLVSYPDNRTLYDRLTEAGFTKVLLWINVSDYDALIQFVRDVSMIASGTVPDSIQEMNQKLETVQNGVSQVSEGDRAKGLFVWYTSGQLDVGSAPITNSMLDACNAINIGYNEDTTSHYGDTNLIISLLEANPGTVVFINASYANAGYTVEDFRNSVLGGDRTIPVVIMDSLWNNWCPESADGLLTMAQYLYPDLLGEPYEGYIDEYDIAPTQTGDGDGDNTLIYIIVAVIVIVIIAAAVVFKMRKP